jgi:hypothetical protein
LVFSLLDEYSQNFNQTFPLSSVILPSQAILSIEISHLLLSCNILRIHFTIIAKFPYHRVNYERRMLCAKDYY